MGTTTWRRLDARLREATRADLDLPGLAEAVCAAVARHAPHDFACFATTDPATGLITWAWKTRSLGVGDEEFAASEYGAPDVNSFTEIARRRPPVGALWLDTGGAPQTCRRLRDYMGPRFGFTDELRLSCLSRGTTWAAVALYRGPGEPPFTAAEVEQLGAVSEQLAEAVQRTLFRRGPSSPASAASAASAAQDGPAVLVVDADDRVTQSTPAAQAAVEEFGGPDHGSLPASVLAVIASVRTHAQHTSTRVRGSSGRWLSLRAAPLAGPAGRSDVVVTVEPAPHSALSRLALAAHGLTAREEEVALLVLQGADTRAIAAALHLSAYTVQDHLKVVFAKVGVTSRRELTARLVLG